MRTSARNVALVLFSEAELLDVAGPLQVLSHAGRHWNWRPFRVFTVGRAAGLIETRSQLRVRAEHSLEECPTPELVIVPGGYGARRALSEGPLVDWIHAAGERADLVLAVGYGCLLLAKAGLLDGVEVSVPSDACELIHDLAPSARARSDLRVAESGKVLTAALSAAGIDLGLCALARVLGAKQAVAVASALGQAWHPSTGAPLRIEIVHAERDG